MRINVTIDATVKEMNTMKNPTEFELPDALLGKIVAAVRETDRLMALAMETGAEREINDTKDPCAG